MIGIKCVYDPPDRSDGVRILVDRLWPRGPGKDAARNNAVALREIAEDPRRQAA